jgi:hypothetical protein
MTPMFHPAASLMLVGCEDDLAEECARAFPELLVLRVAHASAAMERMLVTRPLVVLLGAEITNASEHAVVIDCARDIRAEVVRVASVRSEDLQAVVRESLLLAETSREEPTLPPTPRSDRSH